MWVRESGEKDLLRPPNIFVFLEVGERGESFDAGAVCLARPLRHPKTAFSVIRVASALFRSRTYPPLTRYRDNNLGNISCHSLPATSRPFLVAWHTPSIRKRSHSLGIASVGTPVLSPWISPEPFTISMILGQRNHAFR